MKIHFEMRRAFYMILVTAIILNSVNSGAQINQYHFRRININNGLSNNQVNTIFEDSKGFMWFGTISGLNRYDGHSFKIFKNEYKNSYSLKDNYVYRIAELPDNKLWIASLNLSPFCIYDIVKDKFLEKSSSFFNKYHLPETGLTTVINKKDVFAFLYSGAEIYKLLASGTTKRIYSLGKNSDLSNVAITDIHFDSRNNIWVIHQDGMIEKIDALSDEISFRSTTFQNKLSKENPVPFSLFIDNNDELWIYSPNTTFGCYHYNPTDNSLEQFSTESPNERINNNLVSSVLQDDQGLIWIGTDHGGINLFDKKTHKITYLKNEAENEVSLSENSINCMYKSKGGLIWAGTFKKGLNFYDANAVNFPLYKNHLSDKNSLPFSDVNRFTEDNKGNIWIGSNGNGLFYFDRKNNTYKVYRHKANEPNSLTNDIIVGLYFDKENKLWIGTYFGGMDCFDGTTFHHYKHDPANSNSLADDRVWDFFEDKEQNLWIATLGGGLEKYDRKANKFYHHVVSPNQNSIASNFVSHITQDNVNNLWIATSYGIDKLDLKTNQFTYYSDSSNSFSSYRVNTIICNSKGNIWAGTQDGLYVYDNIINKFNRFTVLNGLPDNNVLNIVEDNAGYLWVSTPNGVARITVKKNRENKLIISSRNFSTTDGLQSLEFNPNAALKTRSGEIMFGGPEGFNLFDPLLIKDVNNGNNVVFTDLQVLNKSVTPDEEINGHVVLTESITSAKEVTLKYNQDVFSLEFTALNYINPEKNKYAYKLEGFNKDWVYVDENNKKITYTNLNPGTYTLFVKTANGTGEWSATPAQLKIIILPPFWRTPLAYFIYLILIAGILLFARNIIIERTRMKYEVENQRHEAERIQALDALKTKFFTNVSHEFRTPLSLILTPLDKILKNTEDLNQKKQLQLVQRNAKRLLNLVNQLLDFRKMETQKFTVQLKRSDIVSFAKNITNSFFDISEKKQIKLFFHSEMESLVMLFDKDKMEKIFFNLLSNAFKYTPSNGEVNVNIGYASQLTIDGNNESAASSLLQICISDTGIGIPEAMHEKVFERYFQHDLPGNMHNYGTGIGLAITKEFVKLHEGNIKVESEPEKGTKFIITIPIKTEEITASENEYTASLISDSEASLIEESSIVEKSSHKKTILLVEDNEDFRFYMKDNLKAVYNIIEAANGADGLEMAKKYQPDVIVSDIMMPVMNGIDLSKKIKTDQLTSHIPIILLTAMTSLEAEMEGFEAGANEYVTKPFTFEILALRVRNLLKLHEQMRKKFQKFVDINPSEITITPLDEDFMKRAIEAVEKNMDQPEFSVEDLSKILFMSRVSFYKKILALTGKTPIEFIRVMRLKRAAQLLSKSQKNINEVAFEVGINNPKIFTRYFKEEFNMTPSQYQASQSKS